jgi:hypothetical protein
MPLNLNNKINCLTARVIELDEMLPITLPEAWGPILCDLEASESKLLAYFQDRRRQLQRDCLSGECDANDSAGQDLLGNPFICDSIDPDVDVWHSLEVLVLNERDCYRRTGSEPDLKSMAVALRSGFETAAVIYNQAGDVDLTGLGNICLSAVITPPM